MSDLAQRTYTLEPHWRAGFMWATVLCVGLAFGALALGLYNYQTDFNVAIICPAMLIFFGLLLVVNIMTQFPAKVKLTTTRVGLEYTEPGSSLKVRWDKVSRVTKIRFLLWQVDGLIYEPQAPSTSIGSWFSKLWRPANAIPLSPFAENWQETGIGRWLQGASGLDENVTTVNMDRQNIREQTDGRVQKADTNQQIMKRAFLGVLMVVAIVVMIASFINSMPR